MLTFLDCSNQATAALPPGAPRSAAPPPLTAPPTPPPIAPPPAAPADSFAGVVSDAIAAALSKLHQNPPQAPPQAPPQPQPQPQPQPHSPPQPQQPPPPPPPMSPEADPLPPGWSQRTDDFSNVYYTSPSGASQWQRPHAAASQAPIITYLDVPFERKDEAKRLGAIWDRPRRLWYATEPNTSVLLTKFSPYSTQR